jgi:hypothetical protein
VWTPGFKKLVYGCSKFPFFKSYKSSRSKNGGLTEQQAKWIEKMLSNHYAVGLPAV